MSNNNFFSKKNTINQKYDNLVIDVNLWYHKNYHVYSDMSYKVGHKTLLTGGIYGFLKTLNRLERDYLSDAGHIYFLFDNTDSKRDRRRLVVDPEYKSDRKKYSTAFYKGLDYLRLILLNYNNYSTVIYGTGFEADDLAPNVIKNIDEYESTILISDDLDWARLINYNDKKVHLLMNKKIYDRCTFNNEFGFMPTESNVIMYKTIKGDKVDNIPVGIPNLPKDKVRRIVDDYETVFDLLDNLPIIDFLNENWKKKISENKARLRLNYQLVAFIPISNEYLKEFTFNSNFKEKELRILYESLGFDISEVDNRVTPIKQEKSKYLKESESDKFFQVPKAKRG